MTFTYVFTYFLVAFVCACICIAILRQINLDMGSEQEVRAFRFYVLFYLLFAASNLPWVWINYGYLDMPGWPWSMINLVAICVASYFWFVYIELRVDPARVTSLGFRVVSLLPLAIAVALVLSTQFTHLVFYYNESNEYIHGPLYSTMAVLALIYMFVATIDIFLHRHNMDSPVMRRQYRILMMFLVFPVAGGIIDIIVPNLPIMELMLLFGLVLVYTNMQQSQIYTDTLTGLNNRRLADEYLFESLSYVSPEKPLLFFIGDIDDFKSINDQYGHIEGDRALRFVAQGLCEATDQVRCHIARWGGDEFVVIAQPQGEGTAFCTRLVNSVNKRLSEIVQENKLDYPLHLSFGYAACTDPSSTSADLLRMADERMYEQKRLLHDAK